MAPNFSCQVIGYHCFGRVRQQAFFHLSYYTNAKVNSVFFDDDDWYDAEEDWEDDEWEDDDDW
ncbi:MAG: hypothetical protein ACFFEX_02560 [Candidatus Thorarchaeota archaeon]